MGIFAFMICERFIIFNDVLSFFFNCYKFIFIKLLIKKNYLIKKSSNLKSKTLILHRAKLKVRAFISLTDYES